MRKRFLFLILIFFILLQTSSPGTAIFAAPFAQTSSAEEKAQTLLNSMTPEERVGQLFLVSFPGTDTSPESNIYDLIVNHHIGGVVFKNENGNIPPDENSLPVLLAMIQSLQEAEWAGSQELIQVPETLESFIPTYIPLLVGISQNGDGYPYDQIYNDLTELPNPMAIGATWEPQLAEQVGFVAGQELSTLGFNLLLGPSLDVLESPSPESLGDLGVRTFGGDPFWVGKMGSAYIEGVHEGSGGKMAVIAKNFPGYGGSDRPPQEEVATVRKSLEQLKQIELAAFYAVTGDASPASTADGLLLAHIRYQGLQGNIRFTTRPISFDEQAFATIMSIPQFASWRENGGVVVTDDLSSRAVRRFYDPANTDFKAWQVARDAFQAGSDLLFVGDLTSTDDPDSYASILYMLDFFTQKYENDLLFQLQVDTSVSRILTLKYELYETFSPGNVLPSEENLTLIGNNDAVSFEVARKGVTLISPTLDELENVLSDAPTLSDRIIFISDAHNYQLCNQCPAQSTLGPEAFQQAVLRLYGFEAGNQVIRQNLYSFTFDDLLTMLDNPGSYSELKVRMQNAQWLVFSMLDVRMDRPASGALRRFLNESDELLPGKKVIVFAFNAPYYLDTTDISKLTAYFGMYSKSPQFVEQAARILFKELTPIFGDFPVSVSGVRYDLNSITFPDEQQTIPVLLDQPTAAVSTPEGNGEEEQIPNIEPTPLTNFKIGDVIAIRTGVIVDHNGHPVPDGTVVQFVYERTGGDISFSPSIETVQGIARTTYLVNGGGQFQIRAISDPATQSAPLILEIRGPEATLIPTLMPSLTPSPSPTLEPTLTPTPVETPQPEQVLHIQTDFVDWGLGFLVTLAVSLVAYWIGFNLGQVRWSIRWALCAWIGGLVTYTYFSLDLPGSMKLLTENGRAGIIWIILVGAGAGWAVGWFWRWVSQKNRRRPTPNPEASVPAKTRSG